MKGCISSNHPTLRRDAAQKKNVTFIFSIQKRVLRSEVHLSHIRRTSQCLFLPLLLPNFATPKTPKDTRSPPTGISNTHNDHLAQKRYFPIHRLSPCHLLVILSHVQVSFLALSFFPALLFLLQSIEEEKISWVTWWEMAYIFRDTYHLFFLLLSFYSRKISETVWGQKGKLRHENQMLHAAGNSVQKQLSRWGFEERIFFQAMNVAEAWTKSFLYMNLNTRSNKAFRVKVSFSFRLSFGDSLYYWLFEQYYRRCYSIHYVGSL